MILLAFVVIALPSMLTDFLLESIGVLPNPQKGLFETRAVLLVLFYRGVYTILAGFIVGKLTPVKPLLHAGILGIVGTTITILVKLQFLAFGWVLKFRGTGKTMKRMPGAQH